MAILKARRALKALKALVKLQALVRGHIVRKQTADMLKRMQTLVKVQARARASRAHVTESLRSSSKSSLSRTTVSIYIFLNFFYFQLGLLICFSHKHNLKVISCLALHKLIMTHASQYTCIVN